jgi:ribonuclease HII
MTDLRGFKLEKKLIIEGYRFICGLDEVGRGSLFGPVVAAACILNPDNIPSGIKDSKKLSSSRREFLFDKIINSSFAWSVGSADNREIECINILEASKLAMKRAVNNLTVKPEILLIDAIKINDLKISQKSYIKGDEEVISISAASIIAKVFRDRMMLDFDKDFPQYNLKSNKGYPTREHKHALSIFGPTEFHRKTFKGVINS